MPPRAATRPTPYATRTLPPQRLIPAISLDAPVVPISTRLDPRGTLVWETAAFAIGHHQRSANPGEVGNVLLSGHMSSPKEGAVSRRLPQVKAGDSVILGTSQQYSLHQVRDARTVPPSMTEVIKQTHSPIVTLVTCCLDGTYRDRLIVRADAVNMRCSRAPTMRSGPQRAFSRLSGGHQKPVQR